jgi:hypothetical protein
MGLRPKRKTKKPAKRKPAKRKNPLSLNATERRYKKNLDELLAPMTSRGRKKPKRRKAMAKDDDDKKKTEGLQKHAPHRPGKEPDPMAPPPTDTSNNPPAQDETAKK